MANHGDPGVRTMADLAADALIVELNQYGHGPITYNDPKWGGYLRVGDAPSFTISVNDVSDGVEIAWQSGLEPTGHDVTGRVGVMNLAVVAEEIHESIEQHKIGLGLIWQQQEDAEREVVLGKSRLQGEFGRGGRVEIEGGVDSRRRARFDITVSDLSEADAWTVLCTLREARPDLFQGGDDDA